MAVSKYLNAFQKQKVAQLLCLRGYCGKSCISVTSISAICQCPDMHTRKGKVQVQFNGVIRTHNSARQSGSRRPQSRSLYSSSQLSSRRPSRSSPLSSGRTRLRWSQARWSGRSRVQWSRKTL